MKSAGVKRGPRTWKTGVLPCLPPWPQAMTTRGLVAPASVRLGAIYTPREGCDIDVGYQARLNHAAPAAAWLAGLTARW